MQGDRDPSRRRRIDHGRAFEVVEREIPDRVNQELAVGVDLVAAGGAGVAQDPGPVEPEAVVQNRTVLGHRVEGSFQAGSFPEDDPRGV